MGTHPSAQTADNILYGWFTNKVLFPIDITASRSR